MLKYLQKFQETEKGHEFHVITFEHQGYALSFEEKKITKHALQHKHKIHWIPLTYHSGGVFILFKKLWDVIMVLITVYRIKKKKSISNVVGFTTLSGAIAYLISKLFVLPLVLLNIEPHSDYMADFGTWKKQGLSYRVLNFLEKKQVQHAKHVAVPTKR